MSFLSYVKRNIRPYKQSSTLLSQSAGGSEPAAATFTPFPRPPLELHRKIVRIAALETMIVPVEVGRIKDKGRDLGTAHVVPIGSSSPLLQVNKEAHEECQMVLTAHHEPRSGEPNLYLNEASGVLWLIYLDEWTLKHQRFAALIPESSNGNLPKIRAIATGVGNVVSIPQARWKGLRVDGYIDEYAKAGSGGPDCHKTFSEVF